MKPLPYYLCVCLSCLLAACTPSMDAVKNKEATSLTISSEIKSEHEQSVIVSDQEIVEIEQLTIGPEKVECQGFHLQQCFLVQGYNDTNPVYFYEQIEGFDYEWGYRYELIVGRYSNVATPADSPKYTYKLINVVSKTEDYQSDVFDYVARYGKASINKLDETSYQLVNTDIFSCELEICAAVDASIEQEHSMVLRFKYPKRPSEPLQLIAVDCADSASAFSGSCLQN